jgi:peptide/nickel transport system substrate-binding protein
MKYHDLRALLVKRFHIPKERSIGSALRRFTLAEKAVFYFFVGLFILSGVLLLWKVNDAFLVSVPLRGGTLTEGVIGNPRFINPVLAISEADKNLTSLVYSGLVRVTPQGDLTGDLARTVGISKDGLTYTAHLRDDATFQDGVPVTADDVIFTISKITDPSIKSPLYGDFAGITVTKVDNLTVTFTLKKPYAPFIDNLTVGILPQHIWSAVSDDEFSFSQFNVSPVGSGPYKVSSVTRDSGGIPNYYDLVPFDKSLGGAPYIANMVFRFYSNENDLLDAYSSGTIQSLSGISPDEAVTLKKEGANVISSPLPRVFGVFFNQSSNKALLEKDVRQALNLAAPKESIINNVLDGYGTVLDGPLPPEFSGQTVAPFDEANGIKQAETLLGKNGWVKDPSTGILEKKSKSATLTLSFTLSTSDTPELKAVADALKTAWTEMGADVTVQVFDTGDLNQNVIRPRRYDALLFGEVVGRDEDVYPFWDSSERNDPGLNIALYANSTVDKLLESARGESDPSKRADDYVQFEKEVENDAPAVFLYAPSFLYVLPLSVHGVVLGNLSIPQDRFLGIRDWYIETNSVWQIFINHS